ncbi:MAG: hypothetical protein IJY63_04715 [Clostridia bacterium]|nr:hypothetical protein [Clostridia bacterium]MBQ8876828.1 hypothetical protein [Clostridia bacterium]
MKIIACDFDGTLCENEYPKIGAPRTDVLRALKEERAQGARVILWTCRTGEILAEALVWCARQGICFDAVNENLPETLAWMDDNSRKVYATEYWDDRAKRV